MRLIDADALLEQMKHRRDYVGRPSDPVCLVEDAPAVGGWVSVKDRLPTYAELGCEEVLVLHESGSIFSIGFDENIEGESIFGEWEQGFDPISLGATGSYWVPLDGVMYWMPVPERPMEDVDGHE